MRTTAISNSWNSQGTHRRGQQLFLTHVKLMTNRWEQQPFLIYATTHKTQTGRGQQLFLTHMKHRTNRWEQQLFQTNGTHKEQTGERKSCFLLIRNSRQIGGNNSRFWLMEPTRNKQEGDNYFLLTGNSWQIGWNNMCFEPMELTRNKQKGTTTVSKSYGTHSEQAGNMTTASSITKRSHFFSCTAICCV